MVGYTYDLNGRIASVSSMAGTITYGYSDSGRLSEVHDSQGRITQYGYDNAGNRTGLAYPNGTTVSYGYDTNNRLRTLEHKNSVSQVVASYAYTLGATGNRTRIDENAGISRAYQYDDLYRLTQDAVTDPAGAQTYTDDYSYDAVGNRLTKTHTAGAVPSVAAEYAYNNADQLLTEDGVTYTYDLNGNLKTKTDASGTTTYTWDYEDRLVKVAGPGGTVTYEYDVDGNRVSSTTSAGTTRYLVDTNRALPQVLAEYTPDGTLLASYTYADDLISMTRGGQTRWYHFDGLGSTRLLTDEAGAVTDTYSYDAFGNLIARTGTTQNDFLFTGQQRDANAGWYYLRARWMDPGVGRFTSVDPFGGDEYAPLSLHRYLYANSSPTIFTDPSGEFGLVELGVSLAVTGILATIALPGFALAATSEKAIIIYVDQPGAGGDDDAWEGEWDDPDTGHTFWYLYDEAKKEKFREGFYPSKRPIPGMRYEVPGVLRKDWGHPYEVEKKFDLTDEQYRAAKAYRDSLEASPPNYHLFNFNCTDAAEEIAKAAGHPIPNSVCSYLGGQGSCPGALGQLLRK